MLRISLVLFFVSLCSWVYTSLVPSTGCMTESMEMDKLIADLKTLRAHPHFTDGLGECHAGMTPVQHSRFEALLKTIQTELINPSDLFWVKLQIKSADRLDLLPVLTDEGSPVISITTNVQGMDCTAHYFSSNNNLCVILVDAEGFTICASPINPMDLKIRQQILDPILSHPQFLWVIQAWGAAGKEIFEILGLVHNGLAHRNRRVDLGYILDAHGLHIGSVVKMTSRIGSNYVERIGVRNGKFFCGF